SVTDARTAAAAARQDRLDEAEERWRQRQLGLRERELGIKSVGAEEDAARAARIREQDAQVNAILQLAEAQKRPLTRDEMLRIQVLRGNSLSSAMQPDLMSLLMSGGLGSGLGAGLGGMQGPGNSGAGPSSAD